MLIAFLLLAFVVLCAWFDSIRICKPDAMIVGAWHFRFQWGRNWESRSSGWRVLTVGVFKLNTMPPIGGMLDRKHYTGFLLRGAIWLPFEFNS